MGVTMPRSRTDYGDMIQESVMDSSEIIFQVWLELLKKCDITSLDKDMETEKIVHKLWNRKQLVEDLIVKNNELADEEVLPKHADEYKIKDYDTFIEKHGGLGRITQSFNYAKKRLEKQMGLEKGALAKIKLPPYKNKRKRMSADFVELVQDVGIKFNF